MSLAVTVALPAVLSVTLKVFVPAVGVEFAGKAALLSDDVILNVFVPATKAALAGRTALLSEEVIPTMSVTFVIRFQLASTALTVTVNAVPAVWAAGEPALPVEAPGAAVSPGPRICNLLKAPTTTGIDALVLAVIPACVESEAITVAAPAVLRV